MLAPSDSLNPQHAINAAWWHQPAERGISFMLRVAPGDERTVEMAVRSLASLTVPHEVVAILNRAELPRGLRVDQVHRYDVQLARAGVEEFLTPINSVHSLTWFYNWCLTKTRYSYVFKWDADFIATQQLKDELALIIAAPDRVFRIPNLQAELLATGAAARVGMEPYLFPKSAMPYYRRMVWWEELQFARPVEAITSRVVIIHDSTFSALKPYQTSKPWFHEDPQRFAELERIRQHIGPTVARWCDPATDAAWQKFCQLYYREPSYLPSATPARAAGPKGAASGAPTYTVVIPAAKVQNAAECVAAIRMHQPNAPIVIVADGIGDEIRAGIPGVRVLDGVKPFNFSANCNLGIRAAGESDVILLNDDAFLRTTGGFDALARASADYGLVSARVSGRCCNHNQRRIAAGMWLEPVMLMFVCVYIPRSTIRAVGELDEGFLVGTWEDNDYSNRVLLAGMKLGVCGACIVDHGQAERRTIEVRSDYNHLLTVNRARYEAKHCRPFFEAAPASDLAASA